MFLEFGVWHRWHGRGFRANVMRDFARGTQGLGCDSGREDDPSAFLEEASSATSGWAADCGTEAAFHAQCLHNLILTLHDNRGHLW